MFKGGTADDPVYAYTAQSRVTRKSGDLTRIQVFALVNQHATWMTSEELRAAFPLWASGCLCVLGVDGSWRSGGVGDVGGGVGGGGGLRRGW